MKKEKNLNINEQIPSFERTLWNDTEDVQTKKEKKIKVKKMNKVKSLKQNVLDLKDSFNKLSNAEIEEFANSLEDIINIYDEELKVELLLSCIIGGVGAILPALLLLILVPLWGAIIFYLLAALFMSLYIFIDPSEIFGDEFASKLCDNVGDIRKLYNELTQKLEKNKSKKVEPEKTEEVKGREINNDEYTLVNLINDTKRNIMMLNNADEPVFNERLGVALAEFKNSLATSSNMSDNMKKDMEYYASLELTKELKSINEEVLKLYQKNKAKNKEQAIDYVINEYMSNIDKSEDKAQEFMKLKERIKPFLDNEDILSKMQIEERLAQCFYYTIKDFKVEEVKQMLTQIEEEFYEELSLVGEEILNEREDNLEITSYYNRMKELKNQLTEYDYLVGICTILMASKSLKLKYLETKNNLLAKSK